MTMGTTVEREPTTGPVGSVIDRQLIAMLVGRVRGEGLKLTGEGGLLQRLTMQVLESPCWRAGSPTTSATASTTRRGKGSGNCRTGTRAKTVLTDVGPVEVRVPREVAGTLEPQIVPKWQRRLWQGWMSWCCCCGPRA